MSRRKVYLGDAVYACVDDAGDVILTTEDGLHVTNRIVLDSVVLRAFESWVGSLREPKGEP